MCFLQRVANDDLVCSPIRPSINGDTYAGSTSMLFIISSVAYFLPGNSFFMGLRRLHGRLMLLGVSQTDSASGQMSISLRPCSPPWFSEMSAG